MNIDKFEYEYITKKINKNEKYDNETKYDMIEIIRNYYEFDQIYQEQYVRHDVFNYEFDKIYQEHNVGYNVFNYNTLIHYKQILQSEINYYNKLTKCYWKNEKIYKLSEDDCKKELNIIENIVNYRNRILIIHHLKSLHNDYDDTYFYFLPREIMDLIIKCV
jgi:hypothetical protein